MRPFVSGLVVAFFAGLVGLAPFFEKSIEQPIQFNHQAHQDLECTGCHEFAESEAFSGLPTLDLCMMCHETPLTENLEEEKIRILANQGQPVHWQRLFQQPGHVFYSHRRHVSIAGLECNECHGDMGNSTVPPTHVHNLTMDDCISCHETRGVRGEGEYCVDCHR
jgi:menaquinone reductase, multiheme cytochrome c subunit